MRLRRDSADHAADSDVSSDEESTARLSHRRKWQPQPVKEVVHRPTMQQLRAAAPGGLLVEDILRRIEFDEALATEDFTALVDPVDHSDPTRPPTPRGAKWCRAHCWTGRCRYADQCWYSHGGPRLVMWGSSSDEQPSTMPSMNRSPLPQMKEVGLDEVGPEGYSAHSLCILLFKGRVVWGRDLGGMGAELWGRFVRGRRHSGFCEGLDEDLASGARQATCMDLPQVVLARVVRCLGAEDLVACALGTGSVVDWDSVLNERWPSASGGDDGWGGPWRPERHLASIVEASRLAAQLLRWPVREAFSGAPSNPSSPSVSPAGVVLCSSPLQQCQDPSEGHQTACGTVLEWASVLVEPAFIRCDTQVTSLRLDSALVVAQSSSSLKVVRRSDLKQITSLKIRDASCFDFGSEELAVGTLSPARLLTYDLSASVPKVRKTLKLGREKSLVTAVAIADADTHVCGLGCEDGGGAMEVVVVDGSHGVVHRMEAADFAPCGLGGRCITAGLDGRLSVWDCEVQTLRLTAELPTAAPASRPGSPKAPLLRRGSLCAQLRSLAGGGAEGRFVVASAGGSIAFHDRARPESSPSSALLADVAGGYDGDGSISSSPFRWTVDTLHVEGPLLVAIARAEESEEFFLDCAGDSGGLGEAGAPAPSGPRLFAWHLPSGRPLLAGYAVGLISCFGRTDVGDGGLMAFGVGRQLARDQRLVYGVVVPGAGTIARASRRSGMSGPVRRNVNSSDVRARGVHKQGRKGR